MREYHGEACSRGKKSTSEYRAWYHMIARCEKFNDREFHNYGFRGISVCPEWRASFVTFLKDMGRKPSPEYTLERIDNDGNYEKDNCKWATRKDQQRNKRDTKLIEYQGRTQSIAAWAEEIGVTYLTLYKRLWKGNSVERSMTM